MHNRFLKESSGGDPERNAFPEQKKDGHLDIYVLKEENKNRSEHAGCYSEIRVS